MKKKLKLFARYLQAYKLYGMYLYILIYWFKKKTIELRKYGTIHIRRNTFDSEIFTQMFIYKQYDFAIQGEVKSIVDLGANNGMSALFFHAKYPTAIIYAIEPDKKNFEALKINVQNIKQIIPINKAIWKDDGYVNLDSGDSWTVRVDMESGINTVESITMDTLILKYQLKQIDLLKIDIETAEKELFDGKTDFLEVVKNLVIELHDWLKPGCSQSFFRSVYNFQYNYSINIENTIITNLQFKSDNPVV